ncbi:putative signal recognition particle subunit SRP9 [Monocercomonoides exilis]|uniref:putative signal recognition particle subunit SRP9 n=1 Tax=Monocercomonoides exilis TaxID=2049356 RepID=UPI003559B901|nr:putative signal recognition particle subunit SRP9 [Monocercomonoides exilis]KAH7821782.1 putative signal recognition particle subunit SRP9 [Monocercomonoides exilis]|eukprot:MONOS_7811.1-p1 / transcript=MONOS_7811.1 / gene=MONOS_7811 / organism=Monocercomonoides_exilis_PA203 / gene_product=unspecified product / transcript_product=unspecified product / location=Mono_scaffold00277:31008-31426(-) / protein_length=82 / sequence_SO=supercontig / SO=protein_coding / is_pseudo=false
MYITSFDDFANRSENLFLANPLKTRLTMKYRNREKKFVIKVTDDRTCYKFITKQQQDIKKIDRLTTLFLRGSTAASSSSSSQ